MQARWEAEESAAAARAAVREKERKEEEAVRAAHYARKNEAVYQQRSRFMDADAKYAERRSQQPREVRLNPKITVFIRAITLQFDLKLFDLIRRVCLSVYSALCTQERSHVPPALVLDGFNCKVHRTRLATAM